MDPIRISGIIGEDTATADDLGRTLEAAGGRPVDVIINSPGGSAFEGAAIYAELKGYAGPVTVRIRGVAASAASLAAMGGDTILVAPAAAMMLHNPASLTFGDSDVHRDVAERLELLSRTYAETYAAESGNRTQDVIAWMTQETWLTAEDAVTLGFADGLDRTQSGFVLRGFGEVLAGLEIDDRPVEQIAAIAGHVHHLWTHLDLIEAVDRRRLHTGRLLARQDLRQCLADRLRLTGMGQRARREQRCGDEADSDRFCHPVVLGSVSVKL